MSRFAGPVLLDNNAIGDAVDLGLWNNLIKAYAGQLETVTTVEAEAGTYFRGLDDPVGLMNTLKALRIHDVSRAEQAALAVRLPDVDLDAGERDLWAHGIHREDAWILCGPDKASIRAAVRLGFKDRLISLEQLVQDAGLSTKGLPPNQTKKWLDKVRGEFVVEETLK